MSMKIRFPGALTTIQDAGRFGFQHMGVSPSGAMDILSMEQANALAGNPQGEAVLEFTLAGPMLTFTRDTIVGLSGADMDMKLNGTPVSPGTSFPVHAGDELISGFARRGCRAYLSVQGGFDVPVIMGSRSTNLKCGLGGFHGRALQAGDELPFRKEADISSFTPRALPVSMPEGELVIHVIPGPQDDYFTGKGNQTFYKETYKITENSDRMGYRLAGPLVESQAGVDIISDGIVFGSVQITPDGMPIIMMADHQTTGGYAKIATVISSDLPLLGQLKPGDSLRFEKISMEKAQESYRNMIKQIREMF